MGIIIMMSLLLICMVVLMTIMGRGMVVGEIYAQGPAVNCRGMMVKHGEESIIDMTGDGKVNMLDLLECGKIEADPGPGEGATLLTTGDIEGQVVPGELLIQLKDISQLENLRRAVEVESAEQFATLTMADLNFVKVKFKDITDFNTVSSHNLLTILSIYKNITPNWIGGFNMLPNDPVWQGASSTRWNMEVIDASSAWDIVVGTTSDPGIFATIIDSGIRIDHPDLVGNLNGNWDEFHGSSGVDDDGNGVTDDIHGAWVTGSTVGEWTNDPSFENCANISTNHGTAVTGIVGAMGNNNQGLAGVNWRARLSNAKIIKKNIALQCVAPLDSKLNGIDYALSINSPVANFSWGLAHTAGESALTFFTQAINRYTYDVENDQLRALAVIGAANENIDLDGDPLFKKTCQSQEEGVICVTGTLIDGQNGGVERFAELGYGLVNVDIAAPGIDIYSTAAIACDGPLCDDPDYDTWSGNSFATPHVTGAVLLVMQANPELSMEQVRDIIFATVDTKEDVPSFGLDYWPSNPEYALEDKVATGGRLNLHKAVKCADDIGNGQPDCLDTVPQPTPTPTPLIPDPENWVFPVAYLPEHSSIGDEGCVFDNPEGLIGPPDYNPVYAPSMGGIQYPRQCYIQAVYDMGGWIDSSCDIRFYTSRPYETQGSDGACWEAEYRLSNDLPDFTGPNAQRSWDADADDYGSPTIFLERISNPDITQPDYKWRYIKMVNGGCGESRVYWETIAVPKSCFTPITYDYKIYLPVMLRNYK